MQHATCSTQHTSERGDATLTDVRLAVKVAVKDEAVGLRERPAVAVGQVGRDQDILARFDLQPVGRSDGGTAVLVSSQFCGQPC